MPRRKPVGDDQLLNSEVVLALPPVRVPHKHEREIDAYQAPPGSVASPVENVRVLETWPAKGNALARAEAREEMRMLDARYRAYLQLLVENGLDRIAALARVFDLSIEEARNREYELHLEVRRGIGATEVGKVLEDHDLGLHERAALMRKWAYSDNPAASLKSIDMAQSLEGDGQHIGSFESFLRLAKIQREA